MISIVVPVYNMENYLERCMNTLLAQTVNQYEIILVDDGSTDKSSQMCDRYTEDNPNLVKTIHKKNGGLSSARNAGMEMARGEYVVFPDPDDWVENNYVEQFLTLQNDEMDLICVGHYINYDTQQISVNKGQYRKIMQTQEAKKALLISPCMNGFAWNKLYRLDIIRKHGLKFLEDVGTTEDLDFTFCYLRYCRKICFAPEVRTYHYYQRSGAATHSGFSRHKVNSIRTYEKIIDDSKECPELLQAAKEEIANVAINLLWAFHNSFSDDIESKKILKKKLKQMMPFYLKSKTYGMGRKVQAVMAYVCLPVYCCIKNKVTKD